MAHTTQYDSLTASQISIEFNVDLAIKQKIEIVLLKFSFLHNRVSWLTYKDYRVRTVNAALEEIQ